MDILPDGIQRGSEDVRASLNRLYGASEIELFKKDPSMKLWRVEEGRFSIQHTEVQEQGGAGSVRAIYIRFSKNVLSLEMARAAGGDNDTLNAIEDAECEEGSN